MKDELAILCIHGAGLGNYIWKDIEPNLGFPCLLIEFPNRYEDAKANSELRFEDYITKARLDIENLKKKKVVIITHSIGGLVGLRIAEYLKDKLVGFVGIGSAIPKNGKSFVSCLSFPQKLIIPLMMKLAGTKPPKSAIEKGLCNDLKPSQTEKIVEKFTAESRYLYTEPSNAKIPNVRKLYITLTKDKEFSVAIQKKMAENLNCRHIVTLESGHLPMLGVPRKLTEILNEFIDSCLNDTSISS